MIEDAVKQTRCTTCDADHEYKEAKVPSQRRKKDAPSVGAEAVPAAPRKRAVVEAAAGDAVAEAETLPDAFPIDTPAEDASAASAAADEPFDSDATEETPAERHLDDDDGPVHRPLIRATLPRPEGHAPERKEPEFTAHQRSDANGNRPGRGPRRGSRPGQTRGPQAGGPSRFGGGSARNAQGQRHGSGFGGQRHGSSQGQGPRPNGGRPGQQRGGQGRPGGGGGRKRGR
jgi:translation initiation factor IF-2